MGFRTRLALFLVVTLAAVQVLTAILVYEVTRRALIAEGERQLVAASRAFVEQLDDISQRVAASVQVLALDYALRAAIAERDRETVLSALRNHGRRVGAARMMQLGLDGTVEADTAADAPAPRSFPFTDLVENAQTHEAAAVVALDGRAYWMVVVPVYAPQPIALIAAGIPIDDALVARLQRSSALPKEIELAAQAGDGTWTVVARAGDRVALTVPVLGTGGALPQAPQLVELDGREYVALAERLEASRDSAPLVALLAYSLDEALRPYRGVATAWAALLALGLGAGLVGAVLIARGVSRPIEALAETARRIEGGDYRPPPPISPRGEIGQLAAAFANMAQAIGEREERISFQAAHDTVTGLQNRVAAEAAISQDLAARSPARGALLMIGIGRLPEIVKTMGHALSDQLTRDAGQRVRALAGDRIAARAADAQFLIWLPGAERADAIEMAVRAVDALGEPYRDGEVAIDLAPAVGIALCPAHGTEASALLQHADVALFAALGSEETVRAYDVATDPHRPERLALMGELREAIDGNQLALCFQPKLELQSRRIVGAESLLRWHHPRRGELAPDAFIALAEGTGNIRRLTRWALAAGIAQAQRWSAAGRALSVAVNLSARDLDDSDLPRRIGELLAVHRVSPERMVLEITESAVMREPAAAIQVLRRLSDTGIAISIDDFGVGQSSLAYLRRLPVRELKIDRSFVQKLAVDEGDRTIVGSIVELGQRLGFRVCAEGVEDAAALEWLAGIGCDHAQGYHIARPLPPAEFDAFLDGGARRAVG